MDVDDECDLRLLGLADALFINTEQDFYLLNLPGSPWSKSRPRFSRQGHAYPDPKDVAAEKETGKFLKAQCAPFTGNVGLVCIFYRPNLKRIDADNLMKHVCDSGNGILWKDDSQITAEVSIVELDRDNPRTLIAVGKHASSMPRGSDAVYPCETCGGPIPVDESPARTCSVKCGRTRRKLSGVGIRDIGSSPN